MNGTACQLDVEADGFVVDALREDLCLCGTNEGCSIGVCSLCSVLVDGTLMSACLLYAVSVDGASITTVEGCADPDGQLSPLQDAFIHQWQRDSCHPPGTIPSSAYLAAR